MEMTVLTEDAGDRKQFADEAPRSCSNGQERKRAENWPSNAKTAA